MEADVFPVETQATRFIPSRTACDAPQVMPLSLNEPVGLKPWCLNARKSSPPYCAALGAGSSGVLPSRSVTTESKLSRNGIISR